MRGAWRESFSQTVSRGAGIALAVIVVVGWLTPASAQDAKIRRTALSREERDQVIEDLENMPGFGSETPRTKSRAAPNLSAPTNEMRAIRSLIDEFAKEMALLNVTLTDELSETPAVRGVLGDAYKLTADAAIINRRARTENDHYNLLEDLRKADADWGELSHRLVLMKNLSRDAKSHIANLNDIANDIRKSLSISQQVNYRDLSEKSIMLATYMNSLLEDIRTELRRTPEGPRLITATSKAHQQVLAMTSLSNDQADLETITDQYRRFRELWYPQAAVLQAQKKDYFSPSLRRIAQTDGEIARLLLMQTKFDKTQIVYLASALRKDIDEFFYYATLDICLKLPRGSQAMSTASEFYGVCENFIDTVNSDSSYDEIVDAFRHIEQADRTFIAVFGPIDNDDAAAALEKISQTLNALRTTIQVDREDFNRQAAVSLAAKIANLTDQIDITSRQWLASDRQPFTQECLLATDDLAQQSADLHDLIVSGAGVQKIRQETEKIYGSWREVYGYLIKCQRNERAALGRYSSQLTPALVQMRTLLTQ